tara:strand:+ start:704 stop:943 length:240 start_codon:yes stop_codon:yes gene_type:complete
MNKRVSKELRRICPPDTPIGRRVYRRLKKQYNKLPKHARKDFIQIARENLVQLVQEQSGGILDEEKTGRKDLPFGNVGA